MRLFAKYFLLLFATMHFVRPLMANEVLIPVKPQMMDFAPTVKLTGKIEPLTSAEITTEWSTLIAKVLVTKGQHVKKDQVLAEVDNRESRFFLAYYKTFYNSITEQVDRLRSDLKYLTKRQTKLRELAAKGVIPITEAEKVEKSILDAKKSLISSEHQVKSIRDEISQREKQLAMTHLRAPFDGVVDYLIVDPKQLVGSFILDGRVAFAKITKPHQYLVKAIAHDTNVMQVAELMEFRPNRKSENRCQVSWQGLAQPIRCRIQSIDPYVTKENQDFSRQKEEQRSLPKYIVSIIFESANAIPSGLRAEIETTTGAGEKGLALPWNAIQVSAEASSVRVFNQESGFENRNVQLGPRTSTHVLVKRGITPTDVIYARLD